MRVISRLIFVMLAMCASTLNWAASPNPPALYVFGDSLSDIGNDTILTKAQGISPAIPPSVSPKRTYYQGRFSNGPVAVEYLWQLLKKDPSASLAPFLSKQGLVLYGAINFAFGGSASGYVSQTPGKFYVPGVLGQIEMFRTALRGKKPQAGALYVIWTGGNDYIGGLTDQPAEVVGHISKAVETLYALGARNFLIPNLPDLGTAPIAQARAQELSLLTESHNDLLLDARDELATRLQGASITLVDIYAITQNLFQTGTVFGLPALESIAPGTGAVSCLFTNPATCPDVNLNVTITPGTPTFYFWDVLHPTTFVHIHYGRAMFNSLNSRP
ncbi:SGNH/GDSL hydrolase family protein [Nitrosovibrio tenuis]|uniref:Outer membrane lipase/esterase n=1 Tax=Nitrosovibrio tenuis TaxID=1233 RepID=A0A1H7PPH0_9PROT|nr:SGNH/GDSL hydrolase family protein [Nitrosovibrio tenuis]SEL37145.1 outer membrane lipase/esterase [Nitrosovibrio tenuis]